eukprot:CAMPEP_0115347028 /NCGR_PEP_ID=MMETSP0270-20121206/94659_1 /TAXON_ID=71861 /ORGANISM="Scrippsiella trochoidea, Strain CCMP3099" /LENGTH=55 /DNA_ID=CAMNT_0002768917 /DNA_START=1338 /DNA_END=1505 /DNA_ORIENTATION=+
MEVRRSPVDVADLAPPPQGPQSSGTPQPKPALAEESARVLAEPPLLQATVLASAR